MKHYLCKTIIIGLNDMIGHQNVRKLKRFPTKLKILYQILSLLAFHENFQSKMGVRNRCEL